MCGIEVKPFIKYLGYDLMMNRTTLIQAAKFRALKYCRKMGNRAILPNSEANMMVRMMYFESCLRYYFVPFYATGYVSKEDIRVIYGIGIKMLSSYARDFSSSIAVNIVRGPNGDVLDGICRLGDELRGKLSTRGSTTMYSPAGVKNPVVVERPNLLNQYNSRNMMV